MIEKIITDTIYHVIREKLVEEGYLPDIKAIPNYDSDDVDLAEIAAELWQTQMKAIVVEKGFCIEVLGFSSAQYKAEKKACRIVVDVHQFLPGELGNDTSVYYTANTNASGVITSYSRVRSTAILSELTFSVYAVGASALHMQTMNHLIMMALPYKGYMKPLTSPTFLTYNNFLVLLTDKGKSAELLSGVMERYFIYKIPDLQEIPEIMVPGPPLSPIYEINLLPRIDGESEPEETASS